MGALAAVGVAAEQHGQSHIFSARAEIILAAGAIGSPHILQLSGIGPGALCQSYGIETVCDQPNVGQHLADHLQPTECSSPMLRSHGHCTPA